MIMAMHDIPYMATCSPAYIPDMVRKLEKAIEASKTGLAYLHVFNPCLTGWGIRPDTSIEVSRLAVETNFFPLYEVENGRFTINKKFKEPKPLKEYLGRMKKFRHLNDKEIADIQQLVDKKWQRLVQLEQL